MWIMCDLLHESVLQKDIVNTYQSKYLSKSFRLAFSPQVNSDVNLEQRLERHFVPWSQGVYSLLRAFDQARELPMPTLLNFYLTSTLECLRVCFAEIKRYKSCFRIRMFCFRTVGCSKTSLGSPIYCTFHFGWIGGVQTSFGQVILAYKIVYIVYIKCFKHKKNSQTISWNPNPLTAPIAITTRTGQ